MFDKSTSAFLKYGSEHHEQNIDESPEDAEERLWAEKTLRELRNHNAINGVTESLGTTLKRLRALHITQRVKPSEILFRMRRNSMFQNHLR